GFPASGGNVGVVFGSRSAARLLAAVSLLVLAVPVVPAWAAVPGTERSALMALYKGTGGPKWWLNRAGWLGAKGTECSWTGVQCNQAGTSVTGLDLSENGLQGTLPASLGNLVN